MVVSSVNPSALPQNKQVVVIIKHRQSFGVVQSRNIQKRPTAVGTLVPFISPSHDQSSLLGCSIASKVWMVNTDPQPSELHVPYRDLSRHKFSDDSGTFLQPGPGIGPKRDA